MPLSRRKFLHAGGMLGAAALLGGCTRTQTARIGPDSPQVAEAERRRRGADAAVREVALAAAAMTITLAGREAQTWAYGDRLPGPEIRLKAGDVLRVRLDNRLPEPTTIHWHGIALRNDMDGVPGITQDPIAPGSVFTYEFTVPDPGTFWFHSHSMMQLDRGLYAPLVVEDPAEPGDYDREWIVVLDDWTDGIGESPDAILAQLQREGMSMDGMGGMGGMGHGGGMAMGDGPIGADGGDVDYPLHLLNGRPPEDPETFQAAPGDRIRLRVVNAGSDTAYRLALGGHRLTVTHTDGFPVDPAEVDALVIGMGERYDLLVTAGDGVFPLVATAEQKQGQARALLRTSTGATPEVSTRPDELDRRLLNYGDLAAAAAVRLPDRSPDRTHDVLLGADMGRYRWTINGRTFDEREPLPLRAGQLTRLAFRNMTPMFHPMHLHGHTFGIAGGGPRKDTINVRPMEQLEVDFLTDNPGDWLLHCHNLYHQESGMMTTLYYEA